MILDIFAAVSALSLAIYFIFIVLAKQKLERIKLETITYLSLYGEVHREGKKIFFKSSKKEYQVLFCNVSVKGELVINSRTKWEIIDAGKSRLLDQSSFLESANPKIIIVYPAAQVIKRYINENEMVFVKPSDFFYDMHVIRSIELQDVLKEGIL